MKEMYPNDTPWSLLACARSFKGTDCYIFIPPETWRWTWKLFYTIYSDIRRKWGNFLWLQATMWFRSRRSTAARIFTASSRWLQATSVALRWRPVGSFSAGDRRALGTQSLFEKWRQLESSYKPPGKINILNIKITPFCFWKGKSSEPNHHVQVQC